MFTKSDLEYILKNLSWDDEGKTLKSKVELLIEQINLQEEFRNRQIEIQNKMKELDKENQ